MPNSPHQLGRGRRGLVPAALLSSIGLAVPSSEPFAQPNVAANLAAPPSATIPVAVFESDDRRTLRSSRHAELSKFIGLLRVNGAPVCTAFCVAPDMVATASHCLFGTSAMKGPALDTVAFSTAADDAATAAIAGETAVVQRHNVMSGTRHLNVSPPIDAASDWAVARLASPVCLSGGLPLAPDVAQDTARGNDGATPAPLFQIAMHRDLPDTGLRYDGPCAVLPNREDLNEDLRARDFSGLEQLIFHRCDTGPGSSGSPMLVDSGDGPRVAGINIGTYVISHTVVGARAGVEQNQSLPIANTAVRSSAFAQAIEALRARGAVTIGRPRL